MRTITGESDEGALCDRLLIVVVLSSSYECVICNASFESYEDYKPHMKVACRRRIDQEVIKKEPPQLSDENSILLNGGIMMTSEGLLSAADVIGGHHSIAHLHHLHPHLPPHHQASPSYILP